MSCDLDAAGPGPEVLYLRVGRVQEVGQLLAEARLEAGLVGLHHLVVVLLDAGDRDK